MEQTELGSRLVFSEEPFNAEAGEGAFAQLLTPAELRFVRCHFGVPVLGDDHSVAIGGAVLRARRVELAELRSMPRLSLTVVTECAGNGRTYLEPGVEGEPWQMGGVSTAQWTGVPLSSVVELMDSALEVVCTGADTGQYQRSLPREVAMDPATILAWEMNAAPIPAVFGGPLRLIVPGWYGMASVKWVARIDAVEEPLRGVFQTERYVYGPGEPVARVRIKSMFTEAAPPRIAGLAWGGDGVARVEVWAEGGWREARLLGPNLPHAWRRFELEWRPPAPGRYTLRCRATDVHGETQPERPRWNSQGYGSNGVQEIELLV